MVGHTYGLGSRLEFIPDLLSHRLLEKACSGKVQRISFFIQVWYFVYPLVPEATEGAHPLISGKEKVFNIIPVIFNSPVNNIMGFFLIIDMGNFTISLFTRHIFIGEKIVFKPVDNRSRTI